MMANSKISRRGSRLALLAGVGMCVATSLPSSAFANQDGKWFVVRHHTTSECWTAKLIKVDGEYAHAFAQTAGGPYDTKQQAREREAALVKEGTCKD